MDEDQETNTLRLGLDLGPRIRLGVGIEIRIGIKPIGLRTTLILTFNAANTPSDIMQQGLHISTEGLLRASRTVDKIDIG
jgi:hypothetical protein